jgi:hypothetical protein
MMGNLNFEQPTMIQLLMLKNQKVVKIHNALANVYGDQSLTIHSVYKWIELFKAGKTGFEDEDHAAALMTGRTVENVAAIYDLIAANRRFEVWEIAKALCISYSIVQTTLTEKFGFSKFYARWVPRLLTMGQMQFWAT